MLDFRYSVGDTIQAACLSPVSFPPAVLTWYVNSDTADTGHINSSGLTVTEVCEPFFHVSSAFFHSGD